MRNGNKLRRERAQDMMNSLNLTRADLEGRALFKICPTNYPAGVTPTLPDLRYNELRTELGMKVVADHRLNTGNDQRVEKLQTAKYAAGKFNEMASQSRTEQTTSPSRLTLFFMCHFVDFLESTCSLHVLSKSFDEMLEIHGVDRILQHLGQHPEQMCSADKIKATSYLRDAIYNHIVRAVIEVGRLPESLNDFIIFFGILDTTMVSNHVTSVFETVDHEEDIVIRLDPTNSRSLQVKFPGHDTFEPISILHTRMLVSDNGIGNMILELFSSTTENHEHIVPPGSRSKRRGTKRKSDEIEEDSSIDVNCFKRTFVKVSDEILSPEGKCRVNDLLSNNEIGWREVPRQLRYGIRTVAIKKIFYDIQKSAMEMNEVMIATFFPNGTLRQHCVLIDGRKACRTIYDSVGERTLPLTLDSLKTLGITRFVRLYIVKRVSDMNEKTRAKAHTQTGLTFKKGSHLFRAEQL